MTFREEEIPADKLEKAKKWRANLVEKCAEQDDALLEKFLETGDLTDEEIVGIIRKATIARRVVPVYCGSAFKNKGIQRLLDGVVQLPAVARTTFRRSSAPRTSEANAAQPVRRRAVLGRWRSRSWPTSTWAS